MSLSRHLFRHLFMMRASPLFQKLNFETRNLMRACGGFYFSVTHWMTSSMIDERSASNEKNVTMTRDGAL
jgi:hypothetical protein